MQAQAIFVAPLTGVVDHDGVVDVVVGVVHLVRAIGVDHLDEVTVGDQRRVFFVYGDGAVERTMHGITAQQAGTLFQVVFGAALTNHDGTKAQVVTATGLLDQDAGQQTADTAKAVKDNVFGFVFGVCFGLAGVLANHRADFALQEFGEVATFFLEFNGQLADIHVGTAQFQLVHFLQDRQGVVNRQLAVLNLANKAVGTDDVDHRLVDDRTTVNRRNNVVLAVQAADQRNHGFRGGLSLCPVGQVLVDLLVTHGWDLV